MRQKTITYNNSDLRLVLLAGGGEAPFKFKLYSATLDGLDAAIVNVGRRYVAFKSDTPEYPLILNYVNLRYNFVINQAGIRDNMEWIARNIKAGLG